MKICIAFMMLIMLVNGQDNNVYWGSYDLTIPGGSGGGNAVQHLSLPDNAPQFFQFAAFNRKPLQANPVHQPAPQPTQQFRPAPQPSQQFIPAPQPTQQFRPAPLPVQQFRPSPQRFIPAPQQFRPTPQPTQQFRPAPVPAQQFRQSQQSTQQFIPEAKPAPAQVQSQFSLQQFLGSQTQGAIPASTQHLRVFDPAPAPTPATAPATAPAPLRTPEERILSAVSLSQSLRFQNFDGRPEPRPAPRQKLRPVRVDTTEPGSSRDYEHDDTGDNELSRFQLYQLKKKGGQQQTFQPQQRIQPQLAERIQPQVEQAIVSNEVQTSETEAVNRRKVAVRRKKLRNTV